MKMLAIYGNIIAIINVNNSHNKYNTGTGAYMSDILSLFDELKQQHMIQYHIRLPSIQ